MTSKIEWCDMTINPFTGCRSACPYCYARRMARRLSHIPGTVYARVKADEDDPFWPAFHLDVMYRKRMLLRQARKPRRVFVGSMGDMCFEGHALATGNDGTWDPYWTTRDTQYEVARFAAGLPRHTFLLLTKSPGLLSFDITWPANVHLGVSVTGNDDASRVGELIAYAHRQDGNRGDGPGVLWASVEPLLDPGFDPTCLAGLDWVVVGAQTGPGAEVGSPIVRAAGRIAEWCGWNAVPCFVKDNLRRLHPDVAWPMEVPR